MRDSQSQTNSWASKVGGACLRDAYLAVCFRGIGQHCLPLEPAAAESSWMPRMAPGLTTDQRIPAAMCGRRLIATLTRSGTTTTNLVARDDTLSVLAPWGDQCCDGGLCIAACFLDEQVRRISSKGV